MIRAWNRTQDLLSTRQLYPLNYENSWRPYYVNEFIRFLSGMLGIASNDLNPNTLTRNPDQFLFFIAHRPDLSQAQDYKVPYSIYFYCLHVLLSII